MISSDPADDNAAAVTIALLTAEKIGEMGLQRDTVIALFDAEEPPYFLGDDMGSTRFYREQSQSKAFHIALIMDLVGHDVELPIPGLQVTGGEREDLLFMTGPRATFAPRSRQDLSSRPTVADHCGLNRNVGDR